MGRRPGSYHVDLAPEIERRLCALCAYLIEEDQAAGDDSPNWASAATEAMNTIDVLLAHGPDSIGVSLGRNSRTPTNVDDVRQLDLYPLSVRYEIRQRQRHVLIFDLVWIPGTTSGE